MIMKERKLAVRCAGQLHLPDAPGNGLEWDEDAVAHFQADQ